MYIQQLSFLHMLSFCVKYANMIIMRGAPFLLSDAQMLAIV